MKQFVMFENDAILPNWDLYLIKHTKQTIFSRFHCHDYFELFILIDGELTESRINSTRKLTKGDMVLIHPGESHGYPEWRKEKFTFFNMAFRKSLWTELTYMYPNLPWQQLVSSDKPVTFSMNSIDLHFCIYSLSWILPMNKKDQIHNAGLNFLGRIALQFWFNEFVALKDNSQSWLLKIISKLDNDKFVKEGIDYLKKEICVSYEHFSRTFKKYTNQTPAQYLKKRRTRYIKTLLAGSELTIAEIAEECGYENLSHFHHQFKEVYGLSPLQYRKGVTTSSQIEIIE